MYKQNNITLGVLKTLTYSDIFDFPLTRTEIYKFFIAHRPASQSQILSSLLYLSRAGFIKEKNEFYSVSSKRNIFSIRLDRAKESKDKMIKAKKVSYILSRIPTILLIGISGSLSLSNAKKEDDIDLFIICRKNTVWITRFIVTFFLLLLKIKRNPHDSLAPDKICANMYMDESQLFLPQNLFIAHEIIQVKVLWNKNLIYEQFLSANSWVKRYLPHVILPENVYGKERKNTVIDQFFALINEGFFLLQKRYMRKKRTTEAISKTCAKFHPKDKGQFILSVYALRVSYLKKMLKIKEHNNQKFSKNLTEFSLKNNTPGS